MSENAQRSSPPFTDQPRRTSPWIPHSLAAGGVLLLTAAAVAWPAIMTAFLSYISATGCLFDCTKPNPGAAVVMGALAALFVLSPLAAVRLLQGTRPASARVRIGMILITDLALLAFSSTWL